MADRTQEPSQETLNRLCAVVGEKGVVWPDADQSAFLTERRRRWQGKTPLVVRPKTAQEVAALVAICQETGTAVVPQGGNTGLVGGQIPTGPEILLSLSRLNRIRDIDPLNNSITAEAGCVLVDIQAAAHARDRLFPLSLASEGSAQIGGLISTNAGGVQVLRYGCTRDLVLGLEVVTGEGKLWNGLTGLRKNNTGYDLKQLYMGAEGTLGIITAAVCKLFPKPGDVRTAFVAVPDLAAAVELLSLSNRLTGGLASAFELVPQIGIDFVLKHVDGTRAPLAGGYQWYVLMEFTSGESLHEGQLADDVENLFQAAVERGLVLDGVIAQNDRQAQDLWKIREAIPEVQLHEGGSLKHDISIPISVLPRFVEEAMVIAERLVPQVRAVPFGHIGDGNVHFNLSQPVGMATDKFLDKRDEVARAINDLVTGMGGSISAEHGIGVAKRDDLGRYKSGVELELMKRIKQALDPDNIFNPGKLL